MGSCKLLALLCLHVWYVIQSSPGEVRSEAFSCSLDKFRCPLNPHPLSSESETLPVKSRARAAVPFSLEPKRSCANCVWLLSRLRTAALLQRIPFYNTAKQWRTLQKLALTSVDPSNTKFSFPSSLASLRQQQKALALTSPRRAKARVGGNSCKAFKACSEQHALLQGCSKASLAYLCSSCAHQGKPKHAKTCHIMPKLQNMQKNLTSVTCTVVSQSLWLEKPWHQNTRTPQEESSRVSYLHTPAWTRRFWSSPKLQRFLQDPSRCRQQHPTHLSGIKPGVFHFDSPVFVVVSAFLILVHLLYKQRLV